MIRNNSDPAPPHPACQPRPAGYRSSMQELRRDAAHGGPDQAPPAGRHARPAHDWTQTAPAEAGGPAKASPVPPPPAIGRGSPPVASRDVGLPRARGVAAEAPEPGRGPERPRELLLSRDREPADWRDTPEPDRRPKLIKPVRLVCRETEPEPARDSEV